jgi:hypothetical protein
MTPTERILSALTDRNCEPKRNGKGWSARCPAHEDRRPSLSVTEGDDGRALVRCHAGCTVDAICDAVGLRVADLMPANPSTASTSTEIPESSGNWQYRRRRQSKSYETANAAVAALERQYGKRSSLWTYHDAKSDPVGVIVRWEKPGGKEIRPVARRNDGWIIGGMPEPRPLYCLPDLASADRVYITEGEKAADAARAIGLTATTSAHGSQSPDKTDWTPLSGKECVILPDHDDPGGKYADAVGAILAKLTPPAVVKMVELPDLPDHGDIVDWIDARPGTDAGELRRQVEALADEAETIQPVRPCERIERFQPFPTDALPEPIRGFVVAGAKAIGCDTSYVALPMLTVLAAAIGHTRRLRLKRTWTCSTTLWAAVIGESGDKKSPPMGMAVAPFENREFDAAEHNDRADDQYKRELALWKKDYKAWERDKKTTDDPPDEPQSPVAERYLIDDATTEGVTPIMRDNPRGVLLYKDELKAWFGSFDRYVSKKGGDDAFWLKVFNNKLVISDRKTSGTIRARRPFICIIGGIQPGTLRRVLGVDHLESGMAARLLLAWPPSRPRKWTDAELPSRIEDAVSAVIDRLFTLDAELDENERLHPVLIWPTESARSMFIHYYDDHADEMAELAGELKAAWSKLEEYAARLALVIHFARWAAVDPSLEAHDKVDEASMRAGIVLTEWFKNEARRVYSMLSESDDEGDRRKLVDWIQRKGTPVSAREAQQGCRWLRTCDIAEAALEDLVEAGYGDWQPTPPGERGQPTRRFVLASTVYGNTLNPEDSSNTVDVDSVDTPETQPDDEWGEI